MIWSSVRGSTGRVEPSNRSLRESHLGTLDAVSLQLTFYLGGTAWASAVVLKTVRRGAGRKVVAWTSWAHM